MSLLSYVQSFDVQAPTGNIIAGIPMNLLALPKEILDVSSVEVLIGPVDLTAVLKHVQLPPEAGVVPWPADATATTVLTNVTSGLSAAPAAGAVEAWVAAISGTVPVGVRDISDQIRIDFQWLFFNDRGMTSPAGDVVVIGGSLTSDAVTIVVPPVITELTTTDVDAFITSPASVRSLFVQLKIRGRVGNTLDTGDIFIPPIPLELKIVPIPLPSVAALFRDINLSGDSVLVTVPGGSPFSSASALLPALTTLTNLLDTINTAATVTAWATGTSGLLGAVKSLAERIPLTQNVGFKAQDSHKNLGKYNFIPVDWWWDTDIEDRGSSTIAVSAVRPIAFFQHDDFKGSKLTINALPTAGLGGAFVRNLHVNVPQSNPPGCVATTGSPSGGWGNCISSYRWE
ncbi:MAG: hypothetical protein WD793_02935 [Steroidobacteraceae bacterium]